MIKWLSSIHEDVCLAGEKGILLSEVPGMNARMLTLLLHNDLYILRDRRGELITQPQVELLWEQREAIRISVKSIASMARARGLTCREDEEFEPAKELLDKVSLSKNDGVVLADKDKFSATTNVSAHVTRLLTCGVLVKRKIFVSKKIRTSVVHLRKHSRDYDPSHFDSEFEASDEMKDALLASVASLLRSQPEQCLSVSALAEGLGCRRKAGSVLRDFVRENSSKPEFPLILLDTDGSRIEQIDKPGFTRKYKIGIKEDRAEEAKFGSRCVFNLPLIEQAASYLCESTGLSSADFSSILGTDRKRSAKMVQDLNDVYKYYLSSFRSFEFNLS